MPDGNDDDYREPPPATVHTGEYAELQRQIEELQGKVDSFRSRPQSESSNALNEIHLALQDIKQRLGAVEDWQKNLQGQNGIDVNGNVITLNAKIVANATHYCRDGKSYFQFDIRLT